MCERVQWTKERKGLLMLAQDRATLSIATREVVGCRRPAPSYLRQFRSRA